MVQLLLEPVFCTLTGSISGESWTKESTLLGMVMHSSNAALARWSACSFSPLGI